MADRFFTLDQLEPGEFILSGAEAHHLTSVRRIGPGQTITLFNGDGHDYEAEVVSAGKRSVVVLILRRLTVLRELPFPLIVASAIPKGDRGDFLIEKLTELGVTHFIPLITTRSVVQPKPTSIERYQRAVIEASKQCGRNRLMTVAASTTFSTLLALSDLPEKRLLLHVGSGRVPITNTRTGVVVAVGPEGGFTDTEVADAEMRGWQVVSIGQRILRVETAAIAAATLLGTATVDGAG